ncbi:MAG TPA: magnesium transporter CorA family protein [Myxococcales bacterium]
MPDNRFFAIGHSKITRLQGGAVEALAALKKEDFVWFDFYNPAREELNALAEPLGLSPLSIEDSLDDDQVPKIEDFPTYTFILVNGYDYKDHELSIREYDFCLGKNFLVSVHRGTGPRFFASRVDERIKADLVNIKRGPDFLAHVLIDHVVDEKFHVIEAMQDELQEAEEAILQDVIRFKPQEILRLRRRLLTVRKSLVHEREVLAKICRKDSPFVNEKGIYNYRDIYDHLVRFFETTEISREIISNLMEMYLSMLNNRMTVAANQMNAVVKRLTYITTIFMPLTLLAGIGGMSEWSMMTGSENWRVSYPAFLLLMAVIAGGSILLLRWVDRRWVRRELAGIGTPEVSPPADPIPVTPPRASPALPAPLPSAQAPAAPAPQPMAAPQAVAAPPAVAPVVAPPAAAAPPSPPPAPAPTAGLPPPPKPG